MALEFGQPKMFWPWACSVANHLKAWQGLCGVFAITAASQLLPLGGCPEACSWWFHALKRCVAAFLGFGYYFIPTPQSWFFSPKKHQKTKQNRSKTHQKRYLKSSCFVFHQPFSPPKRPNRSVEGLYLGTSSTRLTRPIIVSLRWRLRKHHWRPLVARQRWRSFVSGSWGMTVWVLWSFPIFGLFLKMGVLECFWRFFVKELSQKTFIIRNTVCIMFGFDLWSLAGTFAFAHHFWKQLGYTQKSQSNQDSLYWSILYTTI